MQSLSDLVFFHAGRDSDAVALVAAEREPLTYGRLAQQIAETGEALRSFGIGRNDCVAMVLPDGPEAAVASLAVASYATCAPLNPAYRAGEQESYLRGLECRALLIPAGSDSSAAKALGIPILEMHCSNQGPAGMFSLGGIDSRMRAAPELADPRDVALALYTSGSSARAKLISLSHKQLVSAAVHIRDVLELTELDRCLSVMPLFHIHGLSAIFASLAAGGSLACMKGFSAAGFFETLQGFRPTWYTAAPAIHHAIVAEAPRHAVSSSLRFVRSASAPMPRALLEQVERTFHVPLIEAYGMTEAGPQIASNRLPPEERKPGSVGRAAGPEVAIMNGTGHPLPTGQHGEIAIRGASVCVDGWFRTGDLGYLDSDGHLFITGRIKDVINRGGEKISPREVEEVLLEHPAIEEAAVFAAPHAELGETVAAAIVLREGASETEARLREFVTTRLATFKAPQQIALVGEIPKSSGGKVERALLASRFAAPVLPRTEVEEKISRIWMSVLGLTSADAQLDFFRAGGHSLHAAQVVARMRQEFGVDVAVDALFAHPTISRLADLVATAQPAVPSPRGQRNSGLSASQEGLWFLDQLEPGNPAYNVCFPLRLTGQLNVEALERSLNEIRRRHNSLRSTFPAEDGQPRLVVAAAAFEQLKVLDTGEALELLTEDARRPFDLAKGPLFRATLLRVRPDEHALLLTAHHIITDAWSTGVFYRELRMLYAGSSLAPLKLQFADFAAQEFQEELQHWMRELRDLPAPLALPGCQTRPAEPSFRGSRHLSEISSKTLTRLSFLSQEQNATLFMTLMAAFQVVLGRYSGQEDFLLGVPVANRTRVESEDLIGFFANTLVMRAKLGGDPSFRELVDRVRTASRMIFANQRVPFEKLVEALHPQRDSRRAPLFQVMFAYQNTPESSTNAFELAPGLIAQPFKPETGATKFDLTLYVEPASDRVQLAWHYNADLFDAAMIERMARHFLTLLDAACETPEDRIADLPLLSARERHQLEVEWNQTAVAHSDCCFHQLFEEQAEKTPEALAVECGAERLAYSELNTRANRLAHRLRRWGVGPETIVGISLERSVEILVAVLAVLKAGGAYVALDPDYPRERLTLMVQDSGLQVLITRERLLDLQDGITRVCIDTDRDAIAREDGGNLRAGVTPANLAYLIYTSGSTGRPKGVMITHANMSHCAQAMREAVGIRGSDRYLHTASFAFSSSVRQLAVPLSCGAAVILATPVEIRDPGTLFELIKERRVSVMDIVPSYWRLAIEELKDMTPLVDNELRLILSASERLSPDVPSAWVALGSRARMINMYGQTETTGIAAVHPIDPSAATVPIGRPIPNTRIYVLDSSRKSVPIGVTGEIYVGGTGVGRGYLGEETITEERFVPDPCSPGAKLYRTGDLGRYAANGTIEFVGRTDEQIKVRGFRIEPEEIESTLRLHPLVRESAVVAHTNGAGTQRVVAFVTPKEQVAGLASELRSLVKRSLPDYMAPAAIVELDALPRTPNGKVDRRALAMHAVSSNGAHASAITSRSAAEETLVRVWKEVLRLDSVNPDDNFFDLGGDSLLSVRMISRADQAGLKLNLKQLFEHQTVAELAGVAERLPEEPAPRMESRGPEIRVTLQSLREYGCEALQQAGLTAEGAAIVTEVQLEASLRGQPTHNMDSIPRYARRLLSGALNARPNIRIEHETRISALVDGDNGPGQWVAVIAMETAIRKARGSGIGIVTVRKSNHFGAAGHYVWLAAKEGFIGLCTTNGPVILAPTGGVTPTFGNNPIGVGIPAGRYDPIVLDIAMSAAPRGKIGLQLAEGAPLLPGWILDRFGRPSIDPADLAAGLGVPIGEHKGYGLALVMEALAGVLPGAGFGWDHRREHMRQVSEPRDLGHFFLAIDPELFTPAAEFRERMDRMIEQTKSGEKASGVEEILVPGEAELRARERNLREGVPLRRVTYEALLKYREWAGLVAQLEIRS